MGDKMKNVGAAISGFWGKLTTAMRILLISGLAVILIAAIIVVAVILNKNNGYTVLFEGMDQMETTEVYNELRSQSVDVKIDSDGNLLVPTEQWDALVYELASLGYPQTTPSYATFFDNISMTMTEFEKNETLRFELQDRLQTTLKRINGIKGAIVTITYPKDDNYVWKDNNGTASASVTLTLENSKTFTEENVSAVKNLVAYSAQQMDPNDVKVIDANTGRELSADNSNKPDYGIDERQFYEDTIKETMEDNVMSLLIPEYGVGNIVATAYVKVNYDKIIQETKEYITDEDGNGVKQYEKLEMQKYQNGEYTEGVVGEENNTDIPSYFNDDGTINVNDPDYLYAEMEWAIGEVITQTEKAQGVIEDASMAVTIRSERVLTESEKEGLLILIRNATGIQDIEKISIMSWQDQSLSIKDNTGDLKEPATFSDYLWLLVIIVLIILLLIIAIVVLMNKKAKKKIEKAKAINRQQIQQLESKLEESERRSLIEKASETNKEQKETASEVRKFAKQNPDLTASIIRSMIRNTDKGDDKK
ncbi:MAG: hypothetical protein IJ401_06200 [Oscillospiraceae bacterium]|nr:hypothetical protein [Oscillospiraceae bacterium]